MNHWKRKKIFVLLTMTLGFWPLAALSKSEYTPNPYAGNFGLGLELGDPASWGITGKLWVDRTNAFQGAVKLGDSLAILQLDYLWHDFDLIHIKNGDAFPFYIGVGGNLDLHTPVALAGRLPVGLSYIFRKKHLPLDIYLQLVPTLWFYSGGTDFQIYPELGAHFYF